MSSSFILSTKYTDYFAEIVHIVYGRDEGVMDWKTYAWLEDTGELCEDVFTSWTSRQRVRGSVGVGLRGNSADLTLFSSTDYSLS